ncbi:GNAT family N-acetyltransferase [Paenibacillus sp. P26]|nr:GNAT family N-acetyltransferase [Paenibacillus sp. P26]
MRRIHLAEAFYAERGLASRFHLSDASPDGLDEWLEERGYLKEVPCDLMTAQTADTVRLTASCTPAARGLTAVVEPEPTSAWMDAFLELEGYSPEVRPFYDGLYRRIEPAKAFLRLMDGERCAAAGCAVAEEDWAGFIGVVVHPAFRGKGIGRRLIHELACWSLEEGAEQLYLQVIADNVPAMKLYTGAGFSRLFGYHYRTAASGM